MRGRAWLIGTYLQWQSGHGDGFRTHQPGSGGGVMSKAALVIKCASTILAVGLSFPTVSGTASAEGELGRGGEWADPAYSNSSDNDWLSASELSAITTALSQVWTNQSTDLKRLRASIAEREALMAEVDTEKQLAASRGAAELEKQSAQVQAAAQLASGAVSLRASGAPRQKGASPGSSTKGASPGSSTSTSSDGSSPSP